MVIVPLDEIGLLQNGSSYINKLLNFLSICLVWGADSKDNAFKEFSEILC